LSIIGFTTKTNPLIVQLIIKTLHHIELLNKVPQPFHLSITEYVVDTASVWEMKNLTILKNTRIK